MVRAIFKILPLLLCLPVSAQSITVSVPSIVVEVINTYSLQCSEYDKELVLDGDEIVKLWTDEGELAYVIRAAFTCGDLGELWCGATGLCETVLVIGDDSYNTNRILSEPPVRISRPQNGTVTYWLPTGLGLDIP